MADLLPFPPSPAAPGPPDAEARRDALEIRRSFIVEAPAGSGKTGLLVQRYLKLLADDSVTAPAQVLAITFTLKATAEMRDRVIEHLEAARGARPAPDESDFDRRNRDLAIAVLQRDRQPGWSLLDHPHRLNIRTIDSVCAEIARSLPVLSGSGGRLSPVEDALPLHREAARRTLLQLGGSDPAFTRALTDLLLHRDGNLAECESLIADMLALRDQWGGLIPLARQQLDDAWLDANVLPRLELALHRIIGAALSELEQTFPPALLAALGELAAELALLDGYKGNPNPVAVCAGCPSPPQASAAHLDRWLALVDLLLTSSQQSWRQSFTANHLGIHLQPHHRTRLKDLIDRLSHRDDLRDDAARIRTLPPAQYPAEQWAVAKSLFRVLGRAMAELKAVFAERGQCDFTELGILARHALSEDSGADDLAAALGARLQHLLVDEMQDTSTSQYELLELLTSSWDGHSQTVFLVGDPRQSIYLFRQARVERFIHAMRAGRLGDLPLTRLRLTANFRSQRALVDRLNRDFTLIFPQPSPAAPEALPYRPAQPTRPPSPHAQAVLWHANPIPPAASSTAPAGDDATGPQTSAQLRRQQARRDACEVLRIARDWIDKPLPPNRDRPWSIAVLARSRAHLDAIVAALRRERAPIPFRAVRIETLNQRQEVLDLTALTRALIHPADRVAALAVLRAPWSGLTLADLHTLAGADDPALHKHSIPRLLAERAHLLPQDSRRRAQRVLAVLQSAFVQRARLTPAQLVERAWRSLGGDAYLDPTQLANAHRFFQLLDTLQAESGPAHIDTAVLTARLEELYSEPGPVPDASAFIDLLTIHTAKGLEWDVVFVPALERVPGNTRSRLLNWAEIAPPDSPADPSTGPAHIMLAPIAPKGKHADPLSRWLIDIDRAREAAERKRLFYVAATRAREQLHLFAAPAISKDGAIDPLPESLLHAAWPAAAPHLAVPTPVVPAEQPALAIAAVAESPRPILRRVPSGFDPDAPFAAARGLRLPYGDAAQVDLRAQPFTRPEGSFAARAFGNVVHACLESLSACMLRGDPPSALLARLPSWQPRIQALLRAQGLPPSAVAELTRHALAALDRVLRDPDALWLLAPLPGSSSEYGLTAWPGGDGPASIRVDRIFRAGPQPRAPGHDHLWIVDYKTSTHGPGGLDAFLAAQQSAYSPQLQTYARILAPAHSISPAQVRLALYFPAIPRLIWWPAPDN